MDSTGHDDFYAAAERVFQLRGPLAGAAETATHWLFSPASPDPQRGPTFVERISGAVEQLSTDPREWKPRLQRFREQEPRPRPIPARFFAHPRSLR